MKVFVLKFNKCAIVKKKLRYSSPFFDKKSMVLNQLCHFGFFLPIIEKYVLTAKANDLINTDNKNKDVARDPKIRMSTNGKYDKDYK